MNNNVITLAYAFSLSFLLSGCAEILVIGFGGITFFVMALIVIFLGTIVWHIMYRLLTGRWQEIKLSEEDEEYFNQLDEINKKTKNPFVIERHMSKVKKDIKKRKKNKIEEEKISRAVQDALKKDRESRENSNDK